MKFPPPEVIATWPLPDYEHPRGHGPAGEITVYVLTAIVTVMVAIRMYTRVRIARGFGMDDGFILAAYIFATGFTGISILAEQTVGWGAHIYDVKTSKFKSGLQIVYVLPSPVLSKRCK
ncbi:integral membrane protein [Apiospora marii]|uniref:Integral membrane protein n=1 Tax=Apiospora marii TaxID=335849 RepID=A0ABR1RG55_9PEZI